MKSITIQLFSAFLLFGFFYSCTNDDSLMGEPLAEEEPNDDPEEEEDPEMACIPESLLPDLIAFYPFSNGSLNDESGNANHLSNPTTASAGIDRAGNLDCAFEFDASQSEFLTRANPSFLDNLNSQAFSVSFWFKTNGTRSGGAYEQMIGRDEGMHCPDTFGQWSIGLYDCRNAVLGINDYSLWGGNNPSFYGDTECANDPSLNIWHHMVVTSDGTGGGIQMYINGVATTSIASTGCSNPMGTNNIGDLFLGKQYSGLLDDVAFFNKVLSISEVNELKDIEPCCQ